MARSKKNLEDFRSRPEPKSPTHYGARCSDCPLQGAMPVFGDGPNAPVLAIVGEAPGQNEVTARIPFIGKSGEWLEERLALVGRRVLGHDLSRKDVLLTNAILCFPPGGDLKAFLQRSKKAFNAAKKDPLASDEEKAAVFHSAIDCCRPRLMFELGVPRCAMCGLWDLRDGHAVKVSGGKLTEPTELPKISCMCSRPKWTKPSFGRVKAVLATGNAALESTRGSGGIMEKQMYEFENTERVK